MVLKKIVDLKENTQPLDYMDISEPVPGNKEILVKISTCGVCHTELDEIEGRTPPPKFPVVPGHQVIGRVEMIGSQVTRFKINERVGIAWIYSACGNCEFCKSNTENLCPDFKATGRDVNGGYAEYMTVSEDFAYAIPDIFTDSEAAPLLCAGAIGYRSVQLTGLKDGQNLGLSGFGASGHLVMKMVKKKFPKSSIFVFARNPDEREFAKELGATWTGDTEEQSPDLLDAIIDTTPVWKPVMEGLKNLKPGGRLVINAIRKEEIDKDSLLQLNYPTQLWMEKEIKSVANVTRKDVQGFLNLAAEIPIKPDIQEFELKDANQALMELKMKKIRGAKVLAVSCELSAVSLI